MKTSYSKEEAIEILAHALNERDRREDSAGENLSFNEMKKLAGEFDISDDEIRKAAVAINQIRERKRDELYPEVVTAKWIEGRLSKQEIENVFAELKFEYGVTTRWTGEPVGISKLGDTWEYPLNGATVQLAEMDRGYRLQVIKYQFFHGNTLEAALLAIPITVVLGWVPVVAAAEWLNIFSAVIVATASYTGSFALVKRFTHRMRSATRSKLLEITEFAQSRFQQAAGDTIVDPETNRSHSDVRTIKPGQKRASQSNV